ncbi:MAG: sulfur transferase domain-containing protein [Leptolyngbyaceae cyanobacterium bins.302]|nr:sulfur transferase domain-containing protein [Leptolyngbyaceae cyanobacterium bins.302]
MTKSLRYISAQLSTAGQPTAEDLPHLAGAGFKAILNLRTPGEVAALDDEQHHVEGAGLIYKQVPLSSKAPDDAQADVAIELVQQLPQPLLIHCASGARATAIALIAIAIAESWTLPHLIQEAEKFGLSLEQPQLKSFLEKQKNRGAAAPGVHH